MERIPHVINGELIYDAERFGPVFNPATGEQEKEVVLASAARVEEAIAAARAALPGWRAMSLAKRTNIFFRVRELLLQRRRTGRNPDQ